MAVSRHDLSPAGVHVSQHRLFKRLQLHVAIDHPTHDWRDRAVTNSWGWQPPLGSSQTRATLAGMDHRDVQPWQAAKIGERIGPMLRYLGKLRTRMEQVGFAPDDKLYRCVSDAYRAMHGLSVTLHYLTCEHGVGEPPRRGPGQ